jgi:hypothetical protein
MPPAMPSCSGPLVPGSAMVPARCGPAPPQTAVRRRESGPAREGGGPSRDQPTGGCLVGRRRRALAGKWTRIRLTARGAEPEKVSVPRSAPGATKQVALMPVAIHQWAGRQHQQSVFRGNGLKRGQDHAHANRRQFRLHRLSESINLTVADRHKTGEPETLADFPGMNMATPDATGAHAVMATPWPKPSPQSAGSLISLLVAGNGADPIVLSDQ